jgi:hypothetical protein
MATAQRKTMIIDLEGMLSAAAYGLHEVHHAYLAGELDEDHIDWTLCVRDNLAQWLAKFEDETHGRVSRHTTLVMRDYEEMASSMLRAVGIK